MTDTIGALQDDNLDAVQPEGDTPDTGGALSAAPDTSGSGVLSMLDKTSPLKEDPEITRKRALIQSALDRLVEVNQRPTLPAGYDLPRMMQGIAESKPAGPGVTTPDQWMANGNEGYLKGLVKQHELQQQDASSGLQAAQQGLGSSLLNKPVNSLTRDDLANTMMSGIGSQTPAAQASSIGGILSPKTPPKLQFNPTTGETYSYDPMSGGYKSISPGLGGKVGRDAGGNPIIITPTGIKYPGQENAAQTDTSKPAEGGDVYKQYFDNVMQDNGLPVMPLTRQEQSAKQSMLKDISQQSNAAKDTMDVAKKYREIVGKYGSGNYINPAIYGIQNEVSSLLPNGSKAQSAVQGSLTQRQEADKYAKQLGISMLRSQNVGNRGGIGMLKYDAASVANPGQDDQTQKNLLNDTIEQSSKIWQRGVIHSMNPHSPQAAQLAIDDYESSNPPVVNGEINPNWLQFKDWVKAGKPNTATGPVDNTQAAAGKRTNPALEKPTAAGAPVTISSDDDYEKLPKGTKFIGPDGKTRVKP